MKTRRILSCVLGLISLLTIGGVSATWNYAEQNVIEQNANKLNMGFSADSFIYTPDKMPVEQVTTLQRLLAILNKRYTTDKITDSWDYLINETIQVHWNNDPNEDPYVGSMDNKYKEQIDELFKDVLVETGVSFILKNQDLNGDGFNEIAMYSTSDELDCTSANYDGVVCVYVTVFTPTIDTKGNITGYTMVCESLRGYCYEIQYAPTGEGQYIPSFSTDEWRSSVAYTRNNKDYELPEADRLKYDLYNKEYEVKSGWWTNSYPTKPYGNKLSTQLNGKIPYLRVSN